MLGTLRLPARFRSFGTVCCAVLAVVILLYKLVHLSIWSAGFSAGSIGRGQDEKAELRRFYQTLRDDPASEPSTNTSRRANAVFVVLARNEDLAGLLDTLASIEERFNRNYHYPYVFLNDVPFTETFREAVKKAASGHSSFGLIPPEQWSQHPDWIDEGKAARSRQALAEKKVPYGDSVAYRGMSRYFSGFMALHTLLQNYDYYWRLEPSVQYHCDMAYDPFLYMQDRALEYGFVISLHEYPETIPTLWKTTKDFVRTHPTLIPDVNAEAFLSNDGGLTYNECQTWSNMHIASFALFRSEAYQTFFKYLDRSGGFFYERWGDAPVQSIAVFLFLQFEQIHFFGDIGYEHPPWLHCPTGILHETRCSCNATQSFENHWWSCTPNFLRLKKQGQAPRRKSVFD